MQNQMLMQLLTGLSELKVAKTVLIPQGHLLFEF
jgi:hypothetical protein